MLTMDFLINDRVHIYQLGHDNEYYGTIRGKASDGIIPVYIVEFDDVVDGTKFHTIPSSCLKIL